MAMRLKKSHAITAIVCGLLLTYQNCAQMPDSSDQSAQEFQDGLPFAYDAKIDTLAYMSCSEITSDMTGAAARRAYFTFRAGAYQPATGGIKLTTDFRNQTKFYTPEARAQTLASSTLSGNTRLSFSVRKRTNLQSFFHDTNPGIKVSIDGFLPPMSSAEVAGPLSAYTGGYLNYFPSANGKRVMEASLNTTSSEYMANQLRQGLESGGTAPLTLVMGYSTSSDESDTGLRTPITYAADRTTVVATPTNQAYGLGFIPSFGYPSYPTAVTSGDTRRVLKTLTETNLATGAVTANWACPNTMQFMIVRPEDAVANTSLCDRKPDPAADDALNAIRRVLRTEDWYVDMAHRCVVPKGIDNRSGDICYGSTLSGRSITYNSTSCNFFQPAGSSGATLSTTCPHYVSVCVRQ